MIGNVAIAELVFDAAMQCRVAIDESVVEDYAEAMKAEATFPPIHVWKIEDLEGVLVTDGWHRARAAERAGLAEIVADIREGNRREALLDAVRANATHGLQRSRDDKRRAVAVLLRDPEWAALSNRDLGELAGVSHQHVANIRKHYLVRKGELLTDARVEEVDGEVPEKWKPIFAKVGEWHQKTIQAIRRAQDLEGVHKARRGAADYIAGLSEGIALRLEELATEPWPWAAKDKTAADRKARAAALDTHDALEDAIRSKACPDRLQLYKVWVAASGIGGANRYQALEARPFLKGRPAFEAVVERRLAELDAKSKDQPPNPHEVASRIFQMDEDALQVEAVASATSDVFEALHARRLREPARVAMRQRLEVDGVETGDCPDPTCPGFWRATKWGGKSCLVCSMPPAGVATQIGNVMTRAAALLLAGVRLEVDLGDEQFEGPVVVIDPAALQLLRACDTDHPTWAPQAVLESVEPYRASVRAWVESIDEDGQVEGGAA